MAPLTVPDGQPIIFCPDGSFPPQMPNAHKVGDMHFEDSGSPSINTEKHKDDFQDFGSPSIDTEKHKNEGGAEAMQIPKDLCRIDGIRQTLPPWRVSLEGAHVTPAMPTSIPCSFDTDHLISALSAALPEVDFGRIPGIDGCDEQQCEQSMIMDVGVPNSRRSRRENTVSKVWRFDSTKHPVPPWRISLKATPAVEPSKTYMQSKEPIKEDTVSTVWRFDHTKHPVPPWRISMEATSDVEPLKTYMQLATQLERDHDDGSYGLKALDMRTPRYSARSAIRSSNKSRIENALTLPAPSSDTHPWSGMRKRKYREKHIAAYGAALLGDHTSPECAIASIGAVAWSSSDDLACHSFINGSDTSDLQGHKKTKRLKITDVKEVV